MDASGDWKMGMTVRGLAALQPGRWLTDAGHRNEGTLRAKGGPNGARFYFRHRNSAGKREDLPIGSFDESGIQGLTLEQARKRCKELRDRYMAGEHDLRDALDADRRARERQRAAEDAVIAAENARPTLGALLAAYVAQLRRNGKLRAREVESALAKHVEHAWPKLWAKPAADISADDCLAIVAKLVDAGTLRQAGKLRSYLRAAYAAGIRARQSAVALPALRVMKLTVNPARDLATIEGSVGVRDRALSVAELRAYWRRIEHLPDAPGALLRFHLLTGGQRIEQLARARVEDFDADTQCLRLRDPKGKRTSPRIHDVPLIPEALAAMQAMHGGAVGPFVFTVTGGQTGVAYKTLGGYMRAIYAAMLGAGEVEKGAFTPGDLRRTVETRLAALGIGKDVRGQLQSHGLGGVQARHYDRHDYAQEKRAALEALHHLLTGTGATVTPIKRASS